MSYFALIGGSLKHSFSSAYFRQKFIDEGLDHEYGNIELDQIGSLPDILKLPDLGGLNVTIPYKLAVIPYLAGLTPLAEKVGAVNTIFKHEGQWYGHNTDYVGFGQSMMSNYDPARPSLLDGSQPALVLGNGGAAKAVKQVLTDIGLEYHLAVRSFSEAETAKQVLYLDLEGTLSQYGLIINTTPVGTWPNVEDVLPIPLEELGPQHHIVDLIYNPVETRLMREGLNHGATAMNGKGMLVGQAEAAWDVWMDKVDVWIDQSNMLA
jgi:shikimate dehydrogenase